MILDKFLVFSDAQAVTASAASDSIIDLGGAGDAVGSELFFCVRVDTDAASTGSATVTFALQTDSVSTFGSAVTLYASAAIAKASLVAKAEPVKVKIPVGAKRFLRGYYTVGTADLSAGKFDAFLTPMPKIG